MFGTIAIQYKSTTTNFIARKLAIYFKQFFAKIHRKGLNKGCDVLYNLVFLFNVGLGYFLCNAWEICAMLAWYLQHLVIIKK